MDLTVSVPCNLGDGYGLHQVGSLGNQPMKSSELRTFSKNVGKLCNDAVALPSCLLQY